ncbi:hypothetical protein GCM10010294_70290 [Streptomyces griseoloalbus]|nr:hypothetical protein GCM10010294_70290 [Streptomyces griseoloalbus]
MLLRLAYLGMANAFAMLRLLPMSDRDKDMEILALRQQLSVLERQLGKGKVRFSPSDRAFLAALLYRLPRDVLRRLRLLVRPERCSVGTATWSPAATPPSPSRSARADPAPCSPSAPWCCARHGKIPRGVTGASTASCWCWA